MHEDTATAPVGPAPHTTARRWTSRTAVVAALAILVVLPVAITSPYWLLVLTFMGIYIIVTESFRYIVTIGEYSFGHVPLMGMGAYASAVLVTKLDLSFWSALPLAVLVAACVSLVIYYPCLRTTGTFFFFASFAFGEVMRLCWVEFTNPFGGSSGLFNIPRPGPLHLPLMGTVVFTNPPFRSTYYLVMILMVLSIAVMWMLERSRLGKVARAIATSRTLSSFVGIRVWRYEMAVLAIASAFAGLAGCLYAHYTTLIVPSDFYWGLGINVVVWAVVGGVRHWMGPIVGVVTFTLLQEVLRPVPQLVPLIYGVILAGTLVFLPDGLVSLPGRVYGIVQGWRKLRWTTR